VAEVVEMLLLPPKRMSLLSLPEIRIEKRNASHPVRFGPNLPVQEAGKKVNKSWEIKKRFALRVLSTPFDLGQNLPEE
jgi:hypothetical protein